MINLSKYNRKIIYEILYIESGQFLKLTAKKIKTNIKKLLKRSARKNSRFFPN